MRKLKDWLRDRSKEPTTYTGIGLAVAGLGQVFDWDEAPVAAQVVTDPAPALTTGDYVSAAAIVLSGLMGALMREKGSRQ